jgi:16S rRNA (guanine527-N7)-methyltransferase
VEPADIARKHFLDSLYFFKTAASKKAVSITDVASGAGFPGIPIAIASSDREVILIESNGKRISFLEHIKDKIGLNNLIIIQDRIEDVSREKTFRNKFDAVTARAFTNFNAAIEMSCAVLKLHGSIFYYASKLQADAIPANGDIYTELEMKLGEKFYYNLPDDAGEHCIVTVEKLNPTPAYYPREFGKIKVRPLKF